MPSAKELREKRAPLHKKMEAWRDKFSAVGYAPTAEDEAAFATDRAEYDAASRVIALVESAETIKPEDARTADTPGRENRDGTADPNASRMARMSRDELEENRCTALRAWFRHNGAKRHEPTAREVESCEAVGMNVRSSELAIRLSGSERFNKIRRDGWGGGWGSSYRGSEERALSATIGSTGAFTVPETLVNNIEINMLSFGGMMQAGQVIRTASGEPMSWPTADDTSNSGRQIGENAAVTSVQPTFGATQWGAYKFTSDEVLVPTELLEDSVFDIAGVIGEMLGTRLGRILNTKFTTGTGAATPKGIVTASTVGPTTASGSAITWDEITALIHDVDPAYRQGSAFMFHDGVYEYLRKLKDGVGRPLWAEGPNSTPPPTLMGYPYFINQDMQSSVATGTKTMIFGRLSDYKIRQVNEIRMYRLIERNRENDQDTFLAFIRADGNLLTSSTVRVRHMLQA